MGHFQIQTYIVELNLVLVTSRSLCFRDITMLHRSISSQRNMELHIKGAIIILFSGRKIV